MSEITIIINRGEHGDEKGTNESFTIPETKGMVVLDAVLLVQRDHPDLAVRWNCKAGKCGSCSAEINGYPRLLCKTRVDTLPKGEPILVQPMQTFPRVRDLVTDVSWNYRMNEQLPPFQPKAGAEWRWKQRDIERAQEMRKCIECFLCQDVCHVLRYQRTDKPHYAGPRYFVRAAGLDYHPMDDADRLAYLKNDAGIEMCNVTRCCTDVCPEHIAITDNAIIPAKERLIDRYADPLRSIWRRLTYRAVPRTTTQVAASDGKSRYDKQMIELDVRVIPPPQKHKTIHEKLEQLGPGEALRITNDHDPRPLRFELEHDQPGVYSFTYLESGPERWLVDISKHDAIAERNT